MQLYSYISFIYFLRDTTSEVLAAYCSGLESLVKGHYSFADVSGAEMVEHFKSFLAEPKGGLRASGWVFDSRLGEDSARWGLDLFDTQIRHFKGRIMKPVSEGPVMNAAIAYLLVESGLANVALHTMRSVRKRRFWFPSVDYQINLIGTVPGVYALLKTTEIPALCEKLRIELYSDGEFNFGLFWSSLESLLGENGEQKVITLCDEEGPVKAFVAECDNHLISRTTSDELDRLLGSIGVSQKDWLEATGY